jgi:signal transduction histidine kinase
VGVSLFLGSTVRQLQSDKVANAIRAATEYLTAAIHTAQDLAQLISPMTPVRGSVGDALGALCEAAGMRLEIPVEYDEISCPFEMSTATGDQIYRIAEEALAAAARTHGCTQIRVAVSTSDADFKIDMRWSIAPISAGDQLVFVRDLEFDLIAYRARLLGGTTDHGRWEGGEFLVVRIPVTAEASGIDSGGSEFY